VTVRYETFQKQLVLCVFICKDNFGGQSLHALCYPLTLTFTFTFILHAYNNLVLVHRLTGNDDNDNVDATPASNNARHERYPELEFPFVESSDVRAE